MDKIDLPPKNKPITEIMIILKDIRSDISQVKRELLYIKNEIKNINQAKESTESSGWFY